MKKFLMLMIIGVTGLQVMAADVDVPKTESVRSFARPNDARFHYELPANKNFKFKKDDNNVSDDTEEITLDTTDLKPAKKVIKKLGDGNYSGNNVTPADVPMNYESFPKFYDANNMLQNQFMPALH